MRSIQSDSITVYHLLAESNTDNTAAAPLSDNERLQFEDEVEESCTSDVRGSVLSNRCKY